MPDRRTPSGQGPSGSRGGQGRGGRPGGSRPRGAGMRGAPTRRSSMDGPARSTERPTIPIRIENPVESHADRQRPDRQRSATRPASARRPAVSGAARRMSPPKVSHLTGRAAALGLVLLALMLAYAYPVRLYLAQEAQIQAIQTAQADQRARIKSLTQQTAEWNDPAYIEAQAHARFYMVPPGAKTYVVQMAPTPTTAPVAKSPTAPWYGQLWSSIRGADDPASLTR